MFKIESNVPLCPQVRIRYPFDFMKIMDSFFIPTKDECDTYNTKHRLYCAASSWKRRRCKGGITFKICTMNGGIRIWRIS